MKYCSIWILVLLKIFLGNLQNKSLRFEVILLKRKKLTLITSETQSSFMSLLHFVVLVGLLRLLE